MKTIIFPTYDNLFLGINCKGDLTEPFKTFMKETFQLVDIYHDFLLLSTDSNGKEFYCDFISEDEQAFEYFIHFFLQYDIDNLNDFHQFIQTHFKGSRQLPSLDNGYLIECSSEI